MQKSAEILTSLLTINNVRIKGYKSALDETKDPDLKSLFIQFIRTSETGKKELESELVKLGKKPDEATRLEGKINRMWIDFKAAVTGKDRTAILSSCEYGEDVALNFYKDALKEEHLDDVYTPMIVSQKARIKMEHDHVKFLREIQWC